MVLERRRRKGRRRREIRKIREGKRASGAEASSPRGEGAAVAGAEGGESTEREQTKNGGLVVKIKGGCVNIWIATITRDPN